MELLELSLVFDILIMFFALWFLYRQNAIAIGQM